MGEESIRADAALECGARVLPIGEYREFRTNPPRSFFRSQKPIRCLLAFPLPARIFAF